MDAKPLPGTINPSGQKNNDVFKKLSIHMEDIVEAKYAIWMVPLNEWDEIPESTPKFEALADWKIQEGEIQRNPIETIKIDGKVIEGFSRNQDVHYVDVAANKTKVPEVEVVADGEVTIEHAQTLPGHTKVTVTKEGLTTNHYIAFEKDTLKGAPQEAVRYPIQDATVSVGNNPMQTIDGNLGTRWSTEGKQWIEYDLGQVQEVNAVSIAMPWGDQQKYLIDLEVSEDNVNWQNVWNGKSSGTSDKMETYLFDRVPARYVRINVNGNHINTTNNISEVAIYNIEETELQPQVTLVGSGEVMGGEVFDVNIEINGLERLVYAQDLMINYDTKV
ncbi:MAG: discoidin domain-containing protein, partial [Niameybacter sp.]